MKQKIKINLYFKTLFLFLSLSVMMQNINAHGDKIDLELNEIKSIQVSGGVSGPAEVELSLKELKSPFIKRFTKKGIKIDQSDYDHVISTNGEIRKTYIQGKEVYAVKLSFHYREPCSSFRSDIQIRCNLWEHYESLKFFYNSKEVKEYVLNAVDTAAEQFLREFK